MKKIIFCFLALNSIIFFTLGYNEVTASSSTVSKKTKTLTCETKKKCNKEKIKSTVRKKKVINSACPEAECAADKVTTTVKKKNIYPPPDTKEEIVTKYLTAENKSVITRYVPDYSTNTTTYVACLDVSCPPSEISPVATVPVDMSDKQVVESEELPSTGPNPFGYSFIALPICAVGYLIRKKYKNNSTSKYKLL